MASRPTLVTKKRMLLILSVFAVVCFGLLLRVAWIQFVSGNEYKIMAYDQQTKNRTINPRRGTIYDRNGRELAVSASVNTISVNPQEIRKMSKNSDEISKNQEIIVTSLSRILSMEESKVQQKIIAKSSYEILARRVEKAQGDTIRSWLQETGIKGIYVDEDTKRYYPGGNLAAHVIGFTGVDNQGLSGIELILESLLKGVPGSILNQVDASQKEVPFNVEKRVEAVDGYHVVLTLDETIQSLTEKALDKAIADNKVKDGAMAVVISPKTGEVLALASKPDFNLNDPFAAPAGTSSDKWDGTSTEAVSILNKTVWRNKAIADTYEPGSTFKAVTSAAGLEEKVIKPDSIVTDVTVTVGGHNINCWKPNFHGNETFTEGVYNSCNPVFVRVAQSLGVERFYKYVKAFGFKDKTGLGLPGEGQTIFHQKPTEVDMATASFGQRFQITPIHLASAYGAIANGGTLMKPQIIREIRDDKGNVVKSFEPVKVRDVISKDTATTLINILEGVVSTGTGKNAYVKGYRVAGKTGTSETLDKNRYIASFCAFAPADDPQVVLLVALDNPLVYPHTGGMIAAPVAGKLMEDIMGYLQVERRYTEKDKELLQAEVVVPDVRNMTMEEAKKRLKAEGLESKIEVGVDGGESAAGSASESGKVVLDQTPKPDVTIPQRSTVLLYSYKQEQKVLAKVPDLSGKSAEEAARALESAKLYIKAEGLGMAVSQSIKPGELVQEGQVVQVTFKYITTE